VSTGTARFRHGVADDVDLSLEGNVIHIQGDSAAGTDPNVYVVRVGAKYQANVAFAVTGGYGLGWYAGGTFFSPDVGVITGFENRYVVPFFAARVLMSVPLRSRPVDTSSAGEAVGSHVDTAELTGGFATVNGVRLLIPPSFDPLVGVRGSALAGVGLLWLQDGEEDAVVLSAGGGLEIAF
jgi:hypothetical protein